MILVLSFLFGACIGSFVGLIATRLHTKPILIGKSRCLSCGMNLPWYSLIPIVSALLQKARCSHCSVRFGYSHVWGEVTMGIIFVLLTRELFYTDTIGLSAFWPQMAWYSYYTVLFVVLGVITIYDLRHKILPSLFIVLFLLLSIVPMLYDYILYHDAKVFIAPLVVALPYLLLFIITLGRGAGFGDVLMFLGVGGILGWDKGILALLVAIWSGAFVGIVLLLTKKKQMQSAVPFVPFIVLGFFVALFTEYSFSSLVSALAW